MPDSNDERSLSSCVSQKITDARRRTPSFSIIQFGMESDRNVQTPRAIRVRVLVLVGRRDAEGLGTDERFDVRERLAGMQEEDDGFRLGGAVGVVSKGDGRSSSKHGSSTLPVMSKYGS